MNSGRRYFIKKTVLASLASAAFPTILSAGYPANEKLVIGLLGTDSQGFENLKYFLNQFNAECGGIYDSDKNILKKRAAETEKIQGRKPLVYSNYRSLLENKNIDIVINSVTFDSRPLIAACEAGKHIYTKIPLTLDAEDVKAILTLQKAKQNIIQTDYWINNTDELQHDIRKLQSGNYGDIQTILVWNYAACQNFQDFKLCDKNLPRSEKSLTVQSMHILYTAFSGVHEKLPLSVFSTGGNYSYPLETNENPDSMMSVFDFDTFKLLWDRSASIHHKQFNRSKGVAFICTTKTLLIDEQGWQLFPRAQNKQNMDTEIRKFTKKGINRHIKNFLENVKNGRHSQSSVHTAAFVSKVHHLANLSYLKKKKLSW